MSEERATPSPQDILMQLVTGHWVDQMVSTVSRLGIPDMLADGPKTSDALAREADVHPEALFRVMRALSRIGVFAQTDGLSGLEFALTPVSELLRSDVPGSLRHLAAFSGDAGHWRPWGELMQCMKDMAPRPTAALGKTLWAHLEEHPRERDHFDRAMSAISDVSVQAVLNEYDFSSFAHIVDVGGGHGALLRTLLAHIPTARGTLFDLSHVIAQADPLWENDARCERRGGSFFDAVPDGGDVYVLKNIVHDWEDDKAVAILASCRRAMAPTAKLLLLETVLSDQAPPFAALLDVNMMVLFGGKERTGDEYGALLGAAGFRLDRVVPTRGLLTVLEAAPVG